MKKLYTLALALITITASAQFEINFDDMTPGDASPQSPFIVIWPGGTSDNDAEITDEQAFSTDYSMLVDEGGSTDVIINTGNLSSNTWSVQFMMYVPAGKTGFWNIQEWENADPAQWNVKFFVGSTASGGISGFITSDIDGFAALAAYPEDQWFSVTHVIDLDNGTHTVDIDGEIMFDAVDYMAVVDGIPATQLGGVNYYSIDTNNRYYIDNFRLIDGDALSTSSFNATSFNVYPNPVKDRLNIQSQDVVDQVAVYNVLGKLVYQGTPNTVSPSVDMSGYTSGVYFVEVTIGNASKTVKVIK